MSDNNKALEKIRAKIDELDADLLTLINQRAALAIEVAKIKRDDGEDAKFYRPEREAQILRRAAEQNDGPLSDAEAGRLMREIMSACLALESKLRVAYLGPEATYTHLAALKQFGGSITAAPVSPSHFGSRTSFRLGSNSRMSPKNSIQSAL